jgi:hypothetical protein
MFETDMAGGPSFSPANATNGRLQKAPSILKWSVLLTLLGCITLLVWGFVSKVQDIADHIH